MKVHYKTYYSVSAMLVVMSGAITILDSQNGESNTVIYRFIHIN